MTRGKTLAENPKGGAPMGNQFWKSRRSHGRKPKFGHPVDLWNACFEYFEWVEDNPLKEEKLFSYKGGIIKGRLNKMRAMSLSGLCIHLKIARKTWDLYKNRQGFMPVCGQVEDIIYDYQFTGAAAGLLEPRIIARKLSLVARQEAELVRKTGETIAAVTSDMSDKEALKLYKKLIKGAA